MAYIERRVKANGKPYSLLGIRYLQRYEMRAAKGGYELVLIELGQIDPEEQEQVGDLGPVDGA